MKYRVVLLLVIGVLSGAGAAQAQRSHASRSDAEFGPVVRAYLGYLRSEQEVTDDRISHREISRAYYLRNTHRISALRQTALHIARESKNDYLPELDAVTRDELGTLFEPLPDPQAFRVGEVVENTFRFLGTVRSVELFYVFARLDPYEQADLLKQQKSANPIQSQIVAPQPAPVNAATRPRRAHAP